MFTAVAPLGDIAHVIQLAVSALFVLAMLALIGSLGLFLREIFLGVSTLRCPVR